MQLGSRANVFPGCDEVLFGAVGVPSRATNTNKQTILDIVRDVLDSVMIRAVQRRLRYGPE